jgi:hypothetical protein
MTLTLQQIDERKEHLRQEILERECLLATLDVLRKHVAASGGAQTIDLGTLFPGWTPERDAAAPVRQVTLLEAAPQALPPPPPPEPCIHPELKKIGDWHGAKTEMIQWAIARLTGDYTLQDIQALLAREGRPITGAEISVVLSRLKNRRKIVEIRPGRGRQPAIFRKPPAVGTSETASAA